MAIIFSKKLILHFITNIINNCYMMLLPVNEIIRNKFLKSFKNNKITINSRVKQATKDLLSAKIKVDSFDSTHRQICSHKNEILHLTHEIEKKSNSLQISNKCATKIQKVIRGFLTRKKLDYVFTK